MIDITRYQNPLLSSTFPLHIAIFPVGIPYPLHLANIPYCRGFPLRVAALVTSQEFDISQELCPKKAKTERKKKKKKNSQNM